MKKCAIITSYIEGDLNDLLAGFGPDFILCADGGYGHAINADIYPDLLIGDLDSITVCIDQEIEKIIYPSEKDDTDTGICLQYALDHGYTDILIIGGLGGRLDHTISNIELIAGKSHLADRIMIKDRRNSCTVLNNTSRVFPNVPNQYLSLFSLSEKCLGITASGVKYPLENATLNMGSTLGTSNEVIAQEAVISVADGILLVILSDEK